MHQATRDWAQRDEYPPAAVDEQHDHKPAGLGLASTNSLEG